MVKLKMIYYTFPHRYATPHEVTIIGPDTEYVLDRANSYLDNNRLCVDRNLVQTELVE